MPIEEPVFNTTAIPSFGTLAQPSIWPTTPTSTLNTEIDNFLNSLGLESKHKIVTKPERDVNKPIQTQYSYKNLVLRKQESIAYEKKHTVQDKPFQFVTTNGLVGIEIEVENIENGVIPYDAYWSVKGDGSLRNNGVELVSVPLQIKQVQLAMEYAWTNLYKNNKPDFSNRTSIHVHLNCRDLSQNQIYTLCLLYAIFEKHFYAFAGTRRLNSIFCVPLYRTNILSNLKKMIFNLNPLWHKYTGLNLLPLLDSNEHRAFGTIEFRHLYGTHDLNKIYVWIDQILCLRRAVLNMSLEDVESAIRDMNTTSSYLDLYHRIFGKYCILHNKLDFEECVSNVKRELFSNEYYSTLKRSDASEYWALAGKLGLRG